MENGASPPSTPAYIPRGKPRGPTLQTVDNRLAPDRCFFDDDIWISGHMSKNKIQKVQIVSGKRKSLSNTIKSAISGNRSKLQTDLMKYFKNDWSKEEIE